MFEVHKCQNGESMLIFQMEDPHLINTIRLKLRNMVQCRKVLTTDFPTIDPMLQYALPKQLSNAAVREEAAAEYKRIHKTLGPYIVVAVLRGLEASIKQELNAAYNDNNGRIPKLTLPGLKPADEEVESSIVYDIDEFPF